MFTHCEADEEDDLSLHVKGCCVSRELLENGREDDAEKGSVPSIYIIRSCPRSSV